MEIKQGSNVIVGLDIGNITCIASSDKGEILFESRFDEPDNYDDMKSVQTIEVDQKLLVVEKGTFENNPIKHEKENYLHSAFYAISMVTDPGDIVDLVVGIPASQYNTNLKDELLNKMIQNKNKEIVVNGKPRTIQIDKIYIVPEGYAAKIKTNGFQDCIPGVDTLVLDIGGGTSDLAIFDENGNFVNGVSLDTGLLNLYGKCKEELRNYKVTVKVEDAKKYYDGDKNLVNKDREVINEYKPKVLKSFLKDLVNEFRGETNNASQQNIIIYGGGAPKVSSAFKSLYPQTILINDIYANARAFKGVGKIKWQNK